MILTHNPTANRYELRCDHLSASVPKDAGWLYEKDTGCWHTRDVFQVVKLSAYADVPTANKLEADWGSVITSLNESSKAAPTREVAIPRPPDQEYLPYQVVGINYSLGRPGTLIGDEMGLGKTIQALGVINALSDVMMPEPERIKRVLVVCPAGLKINWAKEAKRWLCSPLYIGIADPKHFPRQHNIVIVNYDILHKWLPVILSIKWDLIVGDEAHYVKNPASRRTKCFMQLEAPRRLLLTGTPIVNRPKEIWPLLNWLDPSQYPTFTPFAMRYCGGDDGTLDSSGASNLEELQARLRCTVMVRRFKKDVLTELPPKTRQVIELPLPAKAKILVEAELKAFESREGELTIVKEAITRAREANDTEGYAQAIEAYRAAQGKIFSDTSQTRQQVAMVKLPMVIEYLKDLVDEEEKKVVVFAHHHSIVDGLVNAFGGQAVVFTGRQNAKEKDEAVTKFQNNPNIRLFIGNIIAAGVGITLTASSHVVFAELDWVPGNLSQCEDRCHRIGQRDNVLVQHLVLESSLDYKIATAIVAKQRIIDEALNRKETVTTENVNAMLRG